MQKMLITTKRYELIGSVNTNICLISDIHYYYKKEIKYLNKVKEKIKRLNPEYICIPGDLIDEHNIRDEEEFIKWLTDLSSIAKVIISIGNHEYYINKRNNIYGFNYNLYNKINRINNIYVLDNESKVFNNINFIGLTFNLEYYFGHNKDDLNIDKKINSSSESNKYYNILLSHSPSYFLNKNVIDNINIQLVLCGHMHGGLVPKIFRFFVKNAGLVSPNKKLFPKYVYGNKKINNTNIIITSGVTVISHINKFRILRRFFSGEIVYIKIKDK